MTSTLDGRLVHQPTATAAGADYPYATSSDQMKPQEPPNNNNMSSSSHSGLRYSLTHGKKGGISAAMAMALRRSNKDSTSKKRSKEEVTTSNIKEEENGKKKASDSYQRKKQHSSKMKVFVLLLNPKTKTFELIQLVYHTETTTIGDILAMIPDHATEVQLGSQAYKGLCRPNKDAENLSDLSLLASANPQKRACANVASGEILVAIPNGYSARDVAKFSQAILTNKRFTKLLNKNKSKSSSSSKSKKKESSSSRKAATQTAEEEHDEQIMQRALEKAALAAAQANSSIHPSLLDDDSLRSVSSTDNLLGNGGGHLHNLSTSDLNSMDSSLDDSRRSSFTASSWVNGGASVASKSIGSTTTGGDSLDESLSSWSKSLDQSFASKGRSSSSALYARHKNNPHRSFTSFEPNNMDSNTLKRRPRQTKQQLLVKQATAVTIAVVVLTFMIYNYQRYGTGKRQEIVTNPMGMMGLCHVTVLLLILRKVQFLLTRRRAKGPQVTPSRGRQSKCPVVRIYALLTRKE